MSNSVRLWIEPRVRDIIIGRETVINEELYNQVFADESSPTQSKRRAVVNVLSEQGFIATEHQYTYTDKRQVWKRAKSDIEKEALSQIIKPDRAKQFLEVNRKFELSEFINEVVGVSSVEIMRQAGSFLRANGYEPRQRRQGKRRVSLWSKDWETGEK